jgi:hypothetical protein
MEIKTEIKLPETADVKCSVCKSELIITEKDVKTNIQRLRYFTCPVCKQDNWAAPLLRKIEPPTRGKETAGLAMLLDITYDEAVKFVNGEEIDWASKYREAKGLAGRYKRILLDLHKPEGTLSPEEVVKITNEIGKMTDWKVNPSSLFKKDKDAILELAKESISFLTKRVADLEKTHSQSEVVMLISQREKLKAELETANYNANKFETLYNLKVKHYNELVEKYL